MIRNPKVTRGMSHLAKDSIDLVRFVERLNLPRGSVFHKCDVEEFYMSGDHNGLLADSCKVAEALQFYSSFKRAVKFILSNQLVRFRNSNEYEVYRVLTGAGMGLISSSDMCNWCFNCTVEEDLLRPNIAQSFGLLFHKRFADDIFMVVDAPVSRIRALVEYMRALSGYLK